MPFGREPMRNSGRGRGPSSRCFARYGRSIAIPMYESMYSYIALYMFSYIARFIHSAMHMCTTRDDRSEITYAFRRSLLLDSGVFGSNVAREGHCLFKAMDKEGLRGGKGDNNEVRRPRYIHDPGIQQEPRTNDCFFNTAFPDLASQRQLCDGTPMSPGDTTRDENGTRVAEMYKAARLLARGVDGALGAAASRGDSPGPADGSHLPAPSSPAEELLATTGLEPRHFHSVRHLEPLQDLSRARIDSPHIALITFPGGVPELSVDPGDPGDEAVARDGAKNRACFRIDLMDLPVPLLPHPERPFGPREPRATAIAGRRDRREHTAGLRIDLLDAILGELKQVPAVEGRSCMRGDGDRAHRLPARRIEGVQLVSGRKPDVLTVKRDPMHLVDTRK